MINLISKIGKTSILMLTPLLALAGCSRVADHPDAHIANKETSIDQEFAINASNGNNAVEFTNSIGTTLVRVPSGDFLMGSSRTPDDFGESPQHRVRLSQAFYLGKYEVTRREWKIVMGTNPWKSDMALHEGDDYPADGINWFQAVEFCRRLSEFPEEKRAGREYRLPTEAEWEYACRGGSTTDFHFGDSQEDLGTYAWFKENTHAVGEEHAHRVGLKRPNAYGLHDMLGNVPEWCSDFYGRSYYSASPESDPKGPKKGDVEVGLPTVPPPGSGIEPSKEFNVSEPLRVSRGGGWYSRAADCRTASRDGLDPSRRGYDLGFRLALSPVRVRAE